jgi:hypothetical protein
MNRRKTNVIHSLLILIVSSLMLILSGCTVNKSMGLIQVTNYTAKTITSISIGSSLIAVNVGPGTTVDYWFFGDIKGKLTSTGDIPINDSQTNINWDLKTNYWISISAKNSSDGISISLTYSKNGSRYSEEFLSTN